MKFVLYSSNCRGELANCKYDKKCIVTDETSIINAVSFDHVAAKYKNNYRNTGNFVASNCIPMDCDNDHSDDESDWITADDIEANFCDVSYVLTYSRHHMLKKGDKVARPRFHVYFEISVMTDAVKYATLKKKISNAFPFFDGGAIDSARFIFGVENPQCIFHDGIMTIEDYISEVDDFEKWELSNDTVPEGQRNRTMSHFAGQVLIRYGDTDEAYNAFMEKSEMCDPPLSSFELDTIWKSAKNFYKRVSSQDGYIPPEKFNSDYTLRPDDFSDVGQAQVLSNEYMNKLRYSPSTDFIVYNGSYWEEDKPKAQGVAQELTSRQLKEAEDEIDKALKELDDNGAREIIDEIGEKKALSELDKSQLRSFNKLKSAITYQKYAIKRRDSRYIASALKEARPMLIIKQSDLDSHEFLLNTPNGTYDLRKGTTEIMEHSPLNFITKQTLLDPSDQGSAIWLDALNTFFEGDIEVIEYVQKICGLSAIGKVFFEALIIAYGEGRNGKSTFWNSIYQVLGSYSGKLSADIMTSGCRRNAKPEIAEVKGKRMLIASELEEGMRLSTSNVKQLCSTDEINAEKKYKDPFVYTPTHTLVLYTNHLPKVGASDQGTWRRLIVIPFNAKIEGSSDIKNYTEYLVDNCGGAILSWIMDGAKKIIDEQFRLIPPKKVQDAIDKYREDNNWFKHFLDDCCDIKKEYEQKSGELYSEYLSYCKRTNEYTRSTTDFYSALETGGFHKHRTRKGSMVCGLKIKSDFDEN